MGKASKRNDKAKKAAGPVKVQTKAKDAITRAPVPTGGGQNKREKRIMKHKHFQGIIAKEIAKKGSKKGPKGASGVFDILSLGDALGDTGSGPASTKTAAAFTGGGNNRPRKNKAKKAVAARELQQMSAVLAHAAFQADPLATTRQHLNNTVKPNP